MVVDRTGAVVAGARVKLSQVQLTQRDSSPGQEALSGDDGQFSFAGVAPGPFQLAITAAGFAAQTFSGTLHPGEACIVSPIALDVATAVTEVQVVLSRTEVAEEELKEQEKQRVFGAIPNFYVSYTPNAVPLTSRQKFKLAWRQSVDPVTFGMVGVIAGIQQAQDSFSGYGQGAQGYGKRYGAAYADFLSNTFIGSAILPSLLKQDPRYFYKGTGSKRSRILYAIASVVICKGDNRRWQANYSTIVGSFAAAGVSNIYYPRQDRGVALTFESAAVGLGVDAAINLFQEFLVRKLTPNHSKHAPATP
jgi:hypothetical protein